MTKHDPATLGLLLLLGGCSSGSSSATAIPCPDGAECLSFDNASDPAGAGLTVQNGTVSVDTTKPRNAGGKSLHLVGMTSYGGRAAVNLTPKSFPSAAFYGRVWVYAAQANAPNKNVTLVEASGRATSPDYANGTLFDAQFRIGIQNDGPMVRAGYETPGWYATPPTGPHTDCYQHGPVAMPVNQWFCLTWHFDTAAHQTSVDVDGKNALTIGDMGAGCVGGGTEPTLGGKWVYPAKFDYLTFGWQEYEATSGARELWMDDLAVGSNAISCN
jgi:hypothetical protein